MTQLRLWSATGALLNLKHGSHTWNQNLQPHIEKLIPKLHNVTTESLIAELHKQQSAVFSNLITNMLSVQTAPYARHVLPAATIWQEGSTQLLDYGGHGKKILCVPSLINRSYILDISEKRSAARYLKRQGFHVFVVDWGEPRQQEKHYTLDDYIYRLNSMIDIVSEGKNASTLLLGYCMGGLLSLASMMHKQQYISQLALLATPWNFQSKQFPKVNISAKRLYQLIQLAEKMQIIPSSVIQSFFYYLHPQMIDRKFEGFVSLPDEEKHESLALEHWVNDGISITKNVWQQCCVDWLRYNYPFEGTWRTLGKAVNPHEIKVPTFMAFPTKDCIVPSDCSAPLAEHIKDVTICQPEAGHVGMVAGNKAQQALWQPFCQWAFC